MQKCFPKVLIIILFLMGIILIIYLSRSILKPLLFSIVIAYVLTPLVRHLTSKGLSKRLSAITALFVVIVFIGFVAFYIIPAVSRDLMGILGSISRYGGDIQRIIDGSGYNRLPDYLKNVLDTNISKLQLLAIEYLNGVFKKIIACSMEIPTYALTPVFIYYFLVDSSYFIEIIKGFLPLKIRDKAVELGNETDKVIGSFVRSQIILSLVITSLTFAALIVLKVKYPVLIAIINGITNIIPYFGPIIGLIPAVASAATESLKKVIIVIVVFTIIQQFESDIVSPKLIGDSIGIHPVFIMIILLLGGKYFGAWGLILSIPAAGAVKVTYNYILKNLY